MQPIITNEDIAYSERILLKKGQKFDCERRDFIKNLGTIDLQAVPGSGKTTALLSKLLILERYMPFPDTSGVLVISHTNTAINEIKHKIGIHCPKLFSYPNFIGTIQSFVDQFLTIPCGHNLLGTRFSSIDKELYQNELWKQFQKIYWAPEYDNPGKLFYGRHIKTARKEASGNTVLQKSICDDLIQKEVKRLYFDYTDNKIKLFGTGKVILKTPTNLKYIGIKSAIEQTLNTGIISYEYAYNLASHYLQTFPEIKKIIQERFKYVFVDEMQDMDNLQCELLDELFYKKKVLRHVFQRIGDRNQSIYSSSKVGLIDVWKDREKKHTIKGSKRLSPQIANVVKYFGIEYVDIIGENINSNIPPYLILYNDRTILDVIPKYSELIKDLQRQGLIQPNPKYPFKIIGWSSENDDPAKAGIKDFHPNFNRDIKSLKVTHLNLKEYFENFDNSKKTLEEIRKNILNALMQILRFENIQLDGKYYTKRKFLNNIKETSIELYEELKLNLYTWSISIVRGNTTSINTQCETFFNKILSEKFNIQTLKATTTAFMQNRNSSSPVIVNPNINPNLFIDGDLTININTVHSVKGETHTATLYLETCYHDHECKKSINQLLGKKVKTNEGTRSKESARMMYVGFSRATSLLCFSAHTNRISQKDKAAFTTSGWQIIEL